MIDPKLYIERNAPTIAENCIKRLLGHNTPVCVTLADSVKHCREYHLCRPGDMREAVLDILTAIASDAKALRHFIAGRKELLVSPSYKTVSAYIAGTWETDCNIYQIRNRLQADMEAGKVFIICFILAPVMILWELLKISK